MPMSRYFLKHLLYENNHLKCRISTSYSRYRNYKQKGPKIIMPVRRILVNLKGDRFKLYILSCILPTLLPHFQTQNNYRQSYQPVSDDLKLKHEGSYTRYKDVQSMFLVDVLPNECYRYRGYAQHYRETVLIV